MMTFIDILKILVISIIEGFTHFIPVDDAGHLVLLENIITPDMTSESLKIMIYLFRLGALGAILAMFKNKLNPWDKRKNDEQKAATFKLWEIIAIVFLPYGIISVLAWQYIEIIKKNGVIIAAYLIVLGILLIYIESKNRKKIPTAIKLSNIDYQKAISLSCIMCISLIPGTGRSATAILGAMFLGCSRAVAAEFSFFLAIPETLTNLIAGIVQYGFDFTLIQFAVVIIGMVIAFLVALYTIRFFVSWIKKNDFKLFGYYRIILGAIVFLWFGINSILK